MSEGKKFMCEQCGKSYAFSSGLSKHLRTAHDIIPDKVKNEKSGEFQCPVCDKLYASKQILTKHLKEIHGAAIVPNEQVEKKFKCDHCSSAYITKSGLDKHLKTKHSGEASGVSGLSIDNEAKPRLECEFCEGTYANKYSLKEHLEKVHHHKPDKESGVEENSVRFSCDHCPSSYKQKKDLNFHIKNKHPDLVEEVDSESPSDVHHQKKKLPCLIEGCDVTFTAKSSLDRHLVKQHSMDLQQTEPTGLCPYHPECDVKVNHGKSVMEHLKQHHNCILKTEEKEFDSREGFYTWKENLCKQTYTQYAKPRGIVPLENGGRRMYFNCHRSGRMRDNQGKGLRYRDPSKVVKTGKVCPARIVVNEVSTTEVNITHQDTHVGHVNALTYLRLTDEERAKIAGKLKANNNDFQKILEEIAIEVPTERYHAVDIQDMYNIVRDFNLDQDKLDSNDAVSLNKWVDDQNNQFGSASPVVFYKKQGEADPDHGLNPEDFLLVIMTTYQKHMIKSDTFTSDKILIDSTHGTNQYDFYLTTLLTVDDFGAGVPLAFCVSNRTCHTAMACFFRAIKAKCNVNIKAKVFMSDNANSYYNGWCEVFDPPTYRLLCLWHIQRCWQSNLSLITGTGTDTDTRALVYRALQVVLVEMDEVIFEQILEEFLNWLKGDLKTKKFGEYFEEHYFHKSEMWAFVHRKGLRLNTNMYLEAMHKKLKYIYLKGKANKRMDKLVRTLKVFALRVGMERWTRMVKKTPTHRMAIIHKSHRASLTISEDQIEKKGEDTWLVKSCDPMSDIKYKVAFDDKVFCPGCPLKCWECKVCIHKFTCTCHDCLTVGNFCKHIHACIRTQRPQCAEQPLEEHVTDCGYESMLEEFETLEAAQVDTEETEETEETEVNNVTDPEIKEKVASLFSICNGLTSKLDNSKLQGVHSELEGLLKFLQRAVRESTSERVIPTFGDGTSTPGRLKNIEPQKRLFSTKKKRAQAAPRISGKPSAPEIKSIRETLMGKEEIVIHSGSDHSYHIKK